MPTLILPLLLALTATASATPTAADLAWLSGCWELTRGPRHIVEQWTAPEGGTLLGLSRTVADGRTVEHEFLLIRERAAAATTAAPATAGAGGGLEYVAKPSGQAEAVFTATRVTADEVRFENPEHDFPQRIIYRRQADGGLTARIEGTVRGAGRAVDFRYRPAACGGRTNSQVSAVNK